MILEYLSKMMINENGSEETLPIKIIATETISNFRVEIQEVLHEFLCKYSF
jgi:hypothetical protein